MTDPKPGYPVIIPEVVTDRLRRYFKIPPAEVLSRPAPAWGGKSASDYVASGEGTWDEVLAHFDRMFSWEVTQ